MDIQTQKEIDEAVYEVFLSVPQCMYCGSKVGHFEVLETHDDESLHGYELWMCCHACRDKEEPCETFFRLPKKRGYQMNKWREVWYIWNGQSVLPNGILRFLNGGKFCEHIAGYTLGEKRRRCISCDGHGDILSISKCERCNGTGWEYKKFNN